jgi:hypothetical protein
VTAEGSIRDVDGTVLVRAEGVFLPMPPGDADAFSKDFLPDAEAVPLEDIVPESLSGTGKT